MIEAVRRIKRSLEDYTPRLVTDNAATSAEGYQHLLIDSAPAAICPHTTANTQKNSVKDSRPVISIFRDIGIVTDI